MLKVARLHGLAALLYLVTAAPAHAQTVIITNAPQGTSLEFVLENAVEGTAMVNAMGNATVVANQAHLGTRQLDAVVLVDNCGTTRRVLVLDRVAQPPLPGACARTEINGVFLVQRITTLVVNVGNMPPTLLQRQGAPPAAWLQPTNQGTIGHIPYERHFVLSGGYGLMQFSDFPTTSCGNISVCIYDKVSQSPTAAVAYWILPYLAAEGGYARFDQLTAKTVGTTFDFNSDLDGGLFTIAALAGIPAGKKVTLYAKGGVDYHGATFTTNQNIYDVGASNGDEVRQVAGGSQTLQTRTAGWGWLWGGGVEIWLTKRLGVYGEFERLLINGSDTRGGEGTISDPVTAVFVGGKVRVPSFF
jgi:hypothetical protein